MSQRNLYAGYDLKGKALNNHQAASFLAPIILRLNMKRVI